MKKVAFIILVISLTAPLQAQQAQNGIKGFSFVSPLQLSVGNDSNFLIDRSQPDERLFFLSLSPTVQPFASSGLPKQYDDQVLTIALPTTGFVSDSLRRQFALTYQPEFELFRRNSDQNATNHLATADFSYKLSRRLLVSLSDSYRNSSDPSRTLQNVFLLLPRGSYRENQFRTAATFAKSDVTSFSMRFDHTATMYGQVDQFQRRVMDATTKGYSFIATRMLKRNHRVKATFSRFQASPIDHQHEGDDEVDHDDKDFTRPAHTVNLDYRFSPNTSTVLEFSSGMVNRLGGNNYVFGGSIDRRVGQMWLGGGYSRSLSFLAGDNTFFSNGIAPSAFFEIVLLKFRGQPTRNIGLELTGIGSRSVNSGIVENSLAALAKTRLDYRWSDRTVTFVNFETYQQNRNEWVSSPVSRNRFVMGIEFSLAGEASQRTSRLNRDAENVALTEQGRRRLQPR